MRQFFALFACVLPGALWADIVCTFATECMEGEDCLDSGYSLTIETETDPAAILAAGASVVYFPTEDRIRTDAGDTDYVQWGMLDTAFAVTARGQGGFHLLTFDPEADGAARYSVHMPAAELSLLYIGRCE